MTVIMRTENLGQRERDEKRDKREDEWRNTDWNHNLNNITRLGERLGYTEAH